MGNLGLYQSIVVWAKRAGGPAKLLALVAVGGYGLFRGAEAIIKKIASYRKNSPFNQEKDKMTFLNASPIIIIKSYSDPTISLSFEPGDKYNIIAIDNEAVIIEKLKDTNNPYVVSLSVLREISFHFPF